MINGNEDDFEGFIENVAKVVMKKKCVKLSPRKMQNQAENNINCRDLAYRLMVLV